MNCASVFFCLSAPTDPYCKSKSSGPVDRPNSRLTRTRTNLPPPGPRSFSFLTKNDSSPAKMKNHGSVADMEKAASCLVATVPHVGEGRR